MGNVKQMAVRQNHMIELSRSRHRVWPAAACVLVVAALCGCSMREEMKRIEAMKQASEANDASRSSNLTGEEIYIRSCNTCHPVSGKKGMGPSLIDMDQHFPEDADLKAFIRRGKGTMPAQPVSTLNEREMDNLIEYLRKWNADQRESQNQ